MNEQIEILTQRLDRVERHNRAYRRVGAALLILGGAVLLLNQAPAAAAKDEVRARSFVLVDAKGTQRAALGIAKNGDATLSFYDKEARSRLTVGILDDEPTMFLTDQNRKAGVMLATDADTPRLVLVDKTGRERVWVAVRADSPVLQFFDKNRVARSGLTTFNDDTGVSIMSEGGGGKPGVVLYDKERKIVWSAP